MVRTHKRHGGTLTMETGNDGHKASGNNTYDSEQHLREIMDGLSSSVFVGLLTVGGILTYANRAALDTIRAQPEDVLGKPFDAGFWWTASETSRQRVRLAIDAAAKGVESRFDIMVRTRDGRLLTMDFTLHPVFGDDGRVAYLVPSAYDITERKQAEQALQLTQFAVDSAQDSLLRIWPDGRVHYVNEAACHLLGYARETLLGMHIHQIDIELSEADWTARWQTLKSRGSLRCESMYRHSDGHGIPVEISMSYFQYEGDEYSFFYVADISERKTAQERIEYLAHHDGLTGLPNRILAHERINKTIAFAGPRHMHITVLFIGLDRFKLVNAALGHGGGDEVLRIIAKRMTTAVREIDTVARIGGDEFVVLLVGDAPHQDCPSKSEQLVLDAFTQPIVISGHELFITASIGAAVYPLHGNDAEELLKNAYSAMHRAKELGRNTLKVYSQESGDHDPERLPLEAALRKVLGGDEFRVYFQPQVELSSGKILGAEALLRWQRPESGMLPPVRFIPIAEETGLILPIGEWVLQAACAQCKNWQEQGLALERISVNLSARQFRKSDLSLNVMRLLDETGINPRQLELELTESMLMQDVELAIRSMYALKELGIRIALDDFGTGYSSLSYLKRFPIDTLKIDQSFVREITFDPSSAAIADAIIAMAHRLSLTVIAEGVETEAQLEMLRERGCDEVQGYLVCKPLPADEMTRLLREAPSARTASGTPRADGTLPAYR